MYLRESSFWLSIFLLVKINRGTVDSGRSTLSGRRRIPLKRAGCCRREILRWRFADVVVGYRRANCSEVATVATTEARACNANRKSPPAISPFYRLRLYKQFAIYLDSLIIHVLINPSEIIALLYGLTFFEIDFLTLILNDLDRKKIVRN